MKILQRKPWNQRRREVEKRKKQVRSERNKRVRETKEK